MAIAPSEAEAVEAAPKPSLKAAASKIMQGLSVTRAFKSAAEDAAGAGSKREQAEEALAIETVTAGVEDVFGMSPSVGYRQRKSFAMAEMSEALKEGAEQGGRPSHGLKDLV